MKPIDINPRDLEEVQKILATYVPDREVWAFGSRVTWTDWDFSDLDLAIIGDEPLPIRVMGDLAEAFSESDLPFKVDVLDWATTSPNFRQIIEREYVVLQKGRQNTPAVNPEWHQVVLEDLAAPVRNALVGGPFGSDLVTSDYSATGVPVIRGENLSARRWVGGDFVFVSPEKARRLAANTAGPFDIVFTQRGANHYQQVAVVAPNTEGRFVISQSQMKLSVDARMADPLFVYYLFRAPAQQEYLKRNAIHTGVPHTNLSILRKTPLFVPPLPEQRAIARILGALDDKIELNRRMNETLEAMARALFKSWFVDFDPVHAKAEGRDPGLPPQIAALFPDSFEDSELGPIPAGWSVSPFGEHVTPSRGVSYNGSGLGMVGLPLHNLNSIFEGGGYKHDGIKTYGGDYRSQHILEPGDVIVANTEQGHERLLIGFAAVVPSTFGPKGLFSHHLYRLRIRDGSSLTPDFVSYLLNTPTMHDKVSGFANGTTVNMLPMDSVTRSTFVRPPRGPVEQFTRLAASIGRRNEWGLSESRWLTEIREGLLPKLISGQIRVKDNSRLAAEAHQ